MGQAELVFFCSPGGRLRTWPLSVFSVTMPPRVRGLAARDGLVGPLGGPHQDPPAAVGRQTLGRLPARPAGRARRRPAAFALACANPGPGGASEKAAVGEALQARGGGGCPRNRLIVGRETETGGREWLGLSGGAAEAGLPGRVMPRLRFVNGALVQKSEARRQGSAPLMGRRLPRGAGGDGGPACILTVRKPGLTLEPAGLAGKGGPMRGSWLQEG